MGIPTKDGLCVKCNDGILKPCIGKREKALCSSIHYWAAHRASAKKKEEDKIYNKRRPVFLAANRFCMMKLDGCTIRATEVHHTKGRGIYYLVENTWMAGCHNCHQKVNENPEDAYRDGLAVKRLEK